MRVQGKQPLLTQKGLSEATGSTAAIATGSATAAPAAGAAAADFLLWQRPSGR